MLFNIWTQFLENSKTKQRCNMAIQYYMILWSQVSTDSKANENVLCCELFVYFVFESTEETILILTYFFI